MPRKIEPEIVDRPRAYIGNVLVVCCPPGTVIFDLLTERPLGVVMDRHPVINGQTCYLSTDDYEAAKRALPPGPTIQ